jgi:dUTP pyrophosphatase
MSLKVFFSIDHADFLPRKAMVNDAGADLFSAIDIVLLPGKVTKVPLGIRSDFPPGWEAQVRPKSGYSAKGIVVVFGTIDADYRGEWKATVHNTTDEPYNVSRGQKIAQVVFAPVVPLTIEATTQPLSASERGDRGFGSTGI